MANEAHDHWALLREARDFMREVADARGPCPDCTECDHRDAIIAKVDAALAAHDAVPPGEVVWHMTGSPVGTLTADLGDWVLRVRWDGQDAAWDATRYGRESDEKKAKSAAIAAARGMR